MELGGEHMWPGAHPGGFYMYVSYIVSLHKGEMRELGLQHENELTSIFASELTNCLGFGSTHATCLTQSRDRGSIIMTIMMFGLHVIYHQDPQILRIQDPES